MSDIFRNTREIPLNYTGFCFVASMDEERYYKNGVLHRTDGPAVRYIWGEEYWYFEGKRHRLDGPSQTSRRGEKTYHIHGECLKETDYWKHPLVIKAKLNKILSG